MTAFVLTSTLGAASQAAARPGCEGITEPVGPCIECAVEVDDPKLLANAPPLYWDACLDAASTRPVVHFLPLSLTTTLRDGLPRQRLRTMTDGKLLFTAQLSYLPWGSEDEVATAPLVASLRKRFEGVRLLPVVPDRVAFDFVGTWQSWTERIRATPVSGIGLFGSSRLEIVFRADSAGKARAALARDLGVLGSARFGFRAFLRDGSRVDAVQPLALHAGHASE
jgi:hypothetical protein